MEPEREVKKETSAPLSNSNGEIDEETLRRNRERLFGGGAKKKTPKTMNDT